MCTLPTNLPQAKVPPPILRPGPIPPRQRDNESLKAYVLQKLQELGNTPDSIAKSLRALGIKGEVGCATTCALAAYLHSLGFQFVYIGTDALAIYETEKQQVTVAAMIEIPLSIPLILFVRAFDSGRYHYLLPK